MSLKPSPIPPIPTVTACVAHAAFPHGNVVMQHRDALGTIYTDEAFADLFPTHGQPAEARLLDLLLERCREGGWRKRRRASKNRLDSCPGQDPCPESDLARSANDGLCLECAVGSGSRVGSYPCASRMGRALWQSSWSRRLDAAPGAPGCSHSPVDANAVGCHHLAEHLGATI
jgi:hypothetical protein